MPAKKSAARQSPEDRLARLSAGGCPIHNVGLTQVGDWYVDDHGEAYTVTGCPRGDCDVTARAYSAQGPWVLIGEHARLVGQAPTATPEQHLRQDIWVSPLLPEDLRRDLSRAARETGESVQALVEAAVRAHLRTLTPGHP